MRSWKRLWIQQINQQWCWHCIKGRVNNNSNNPSILKIWQGLGFATKTVVQERFKYFEGKFSRAIMQGSTRSLCFCCRIRVFGSGWGWSHRARPLLHFSTHFQVNTSYSQPPSCIWFNPYWWAVKTEACSSAACKKLPPATCTLASSCSPL